MKTENKKNHISFAEHLDAQYGKTGNRNIENSKKNTILWNLVLQEMRKERG
jgi:hypothetical protein